MTQPGNYLQKVVDHYSNGLLVASATGKAKKDLNWLFEIIESSVCWHLDRNVMKMLWNTDLNAEILKNARLPFQVMSVEYDFVNEDLGLDPVREDMSPCIQRMIALVEDIDTSEFIMNTFFKDEKRNQWGMTPYSVRISYDSLKDIDSWFYIDKNRRMHGELFLQPIIPSIKWIDFVDIVDINVDGLSKKEIEDKVVKHLWDKAPVLDDLRTVLSLLQVLNCQNAPTDTVLASPKLNKKRAKRGKPPLRDYRVLRLSKQEIHTASRMGHTGRTMPTHIRRGHIHRFRLKNGDYRTKWLPPIIVNPGKTECVNKVEVKV